MAAAGAVTAADYDEIPSADFFAEGFLSLKRGLNINENLNNILLISASIKCIMKARN